MPSSVKNKPPYASHLLWLVLAGYWLCLFAGTHWPQTGGGGGVSHDKLAHLAGYAGLACLLQLARFGSAGTAAKAWQSWCMIAIYAALDEVLQIPVPGRVADVWDVVADLVGATAGIVVAFGIRGVWDLLGRARRNP